MDQEWRNKQLPVPHYLNQFRKGPQPYSYYDTPDGQDLMKKLWYTTKYSAYIGIGLGGTFTLVKFPPPERRILLLFDTLRMAFPFVLSSTVFTTSMYALTHIRKKDDVLNANIAGGLAGMTFGFWKRSGTLAFFLAIAGAFGCGLKKTLVQHGIDLPGKQQPRLNFSSWTLRNMDFTLAKDIPGNWTSVPRPVPEPPPPPPPPPPLGVCAGF